jgi:cytochrome c oxidase subunit I+III
MFLAVPFDQQVTDTYFIVAHFHYIIFGAAVFPIFGGLYYWFPKLTGRMYLERPGQISFWIIFAGTNLLFFPMHIVGLLGMPRRIYTYPDGLGWTIYNVLETVGGFVTLVGILLLLGNLLVSRFVGAPAGPDPWHAPTLEWTTSSPPPSYNYAVIPTVSSAYPNWDRQALRTDLVLDDGHRQVETTPVDAEVARVLDLPHDSPWPVVLALTISLVFAALVVGHFGVAALLGILCVLALVGWHSHEPEEGAVRVDTRRSQPTAWWGMAIVLASEGTLFAAMIATYFYLSFRTPSWPPDGIHRPSLAGPIVAALVLAVGGVLMVLAAREARRGGLGRARALLAASILVGCGYLVYQTSSFLDSLDRFHVSRDAYSSIYYTMLAADHAHVAVGVLLGIWLLWKLRNGLTAYRAHAATAIAWYAAFVVLATFLVTATLLTPRA